MRYFTAAIVFVLGICSVHAQHIDSTTQIHDSTKHEKKLARKKEVILPWFVERFKISAGAIYLENITEMQVGVVGNPGSDIDLERDLGFDKQLTTFVANAEWRISRRSRINLSYYNVKRSASTTLQQDIVFDDKTFLANSQVNTSFNTTIYQFAYGYAILSKPTYEAGLLIGTHVVGANAQMTEIGNNPNAIHGNFGITAPLPDLGIWAAVEFGKRFAMNMDFSYFSLTLNDNTGRILAFDINFTYRLMKRLNVSAGFSGLDFKVNTTKDDVTGQFKWGFNGPLICLNYSFGKGTWSHK